MKSKIRCFLVFIILHFVLAGCGRNLSVSAIPTSIPTGTKVLTKTPVLRLTTQTPITKVTSTPTVIGVANTSVYSQNDFLELFRTNGNCQLPCWWGIVPGKTTIDEVKLRFALYGDIVAFEEYQDKIIMFYPGPSDAIDYNISSVINFDETGTVTSIRLDTETAMYHGFNPTYLITNFGKPDQVELSSKVTVLYEEQNILAMYRFRLNPDTNQFCFSSYDIVELWSSEVDNAFPHVKNQKDDQITQAFYDAFQIWKGDDNCFSF